MWLFWKQKNSDYPFHPSQLSDGSIRFICLVTALFQPNPPATIILDEPELGLHPYAIALLDSLLKSAATRMQLIVSTQSVSLINECSIDDLIVVEREKDGSIFKRCKEVDFKIWLEEYSVK
nr:AAA family ATPase [Candidatus Nitrosacidococcus tergens]